MVRKSIARFVKIIDTTRDHIIVAELSRELLGLEKNVELISVYIPPPTSPYYRTVDSNCHLQELESCLIDLLEQKDECYFLICGDLNSRTANIQINRDCDAADSLGDEVDNREPFVHTRVSDDVVINDFGNIFANVCSCFGLSILNGMCDATNSSKFTFVASQGSSTVDYFASSHSLSDLVSSMSVSDRVESAHMPVELTVDGVRSQVPVQPITVEKIVWDCEQEQCFLANVRSDTFLAALRDSCSLLDTADVDNSLLQFKNALMLASECMKKSVTYNKRNKSTHSWYDDECRSSKLNVRRALRKYFRTKSVLDKQAYLARRKDYKLLLKRKERDAKLAKLDALLNCMDKPSEFWREIKKFRRRPQCTGDITGEQWLQHFRTVLNDNLNEDTPDPTIPEDREEEPFLDAPITASEIKKAIKRLKLGRSAGPDGILNEMIKLSGDIVLEYLVKLFNTIFDSGIYPEEWTRAVIVPIHKKGPTDNPDNFRGISLLSTLGKVFTAVLNNRLSVWTEDNGIIDESQAGFRKGRSTVDHIFTLYAVVEKQLLSKRKLYAAFVDFRKAYDSVNRSLLWVAIHEAGVKGKMFDMLRNMYSKVSACVRCNAGSTTEYFECLQGLKQGCVASPILFSLFINSLAREVLSRGRHGISLSPHQVELFVLLFADDLLLLSDTVVGLQNQISVLYEAALRARLSVNTDKTKVVVFRNGGYLAEREVWYYGREKLEVVGSYKYLGLVFSTRLSCNVALRDVEPRAKRGTIEILCALRRMNCNAPTIFFKLFDTQIVPMLLYAAEIWGFQKIEAIEKVHLMACKKVLGVSSRAPNTLVYGELGRYPLYVISAARCIMFWFRLLKQPPTRYSRMAYDMLLQMHERGKKTWVTNVKNLLCCSGFGYVWLFGGVGNEKQFISDLKLRLRDCFCQEWFSHLENSTHFELYNSFKTCLEREKYVNLMHTSNYSKTLARFRIGVSEINAHRFRFSKQPRKQLCPFCPQAIEDEIHVVFNCPAYTDLRNKLLIISRHVSQRLQLVNLFKCNNYEGQHNFSKFLFLLIKKRRQGVVTQS